MKDDRITQKYARTNVDRLIKEFVDQICQATGGPCTYTGRDMTEAHHNMGVTSGEFQAFVEDVVAVLDGFKVGEGRAGRAPEHPGAPAGRDRRSGFGPGWNPAAVRVHTGTGPVSCGHFRDGGRTTT